MVALLARYAARFSVRALDLTVDASLLWVGVGLALVAAVLLAFVPRLPSAEAAGGLGVVERRRADHVRHEPPAAALRRDADRRVLRAAGRRRHAADDAVRAAGRPHDLPDAQRADAARAGHVLRPDAGPGHRLLPGSDAAHLRAARRRAGRGGHAGAVARGRQLRSRLPAHRRGPRPRRRRRRSARAVPDGVAGLLRRARRAAARRPRLQRRRSPRQRAGRDHQPEPGAAAVPEQGRGQPPPDVDRPGHAVHRHEHRPPADRRRRRATSTTRTSCPGRP